MFVLATAVKDEGPAILEWVAYHLSIGFDHIVIAYNDCSDGSEELIRALSKRSNITAIENVLGPDDPPQRTAIAKIVETDAYKNAEYYMHLDADEFLNIHRHGKKVQALAEVLGKNDVLSIHWACFGPKEETIASSKWITKRFQHRVKQRKFTNRVCKSLIRNPQRFSRVGIHGPINRGKKVPTFMLRDRGEVVRTDKLVVNKLACSTDFENKEATYNLAQVNHYVTKSMPEFRLRQLRGRGTRGDRDENGQVRLRHSQEHFDKFVKASTVDTSIVPALRKARFVALKLLLSPAVALAFYKCKKNRKKQITEARRDWDATEYRID